MKHGLTLACALLIEVQNDDVVGFLLEWELDVVAALGEEVIVHNQFHLRVRHLKVTAIADKVVDLTPSLLHRS